MARLQVDVVTAEGELFSGGADLVVVPGELGEMAILPSHAALISSLNPGELVIRDGGGEEALMVSGGFIEVLDNKVTVLADAAERETDIDIERAQRAVAQARERIASQEEELDLERALRSLSRAQVRVKLATRRRGAAGLPADVTTAIAAGTAGSRDK